MIQRDADGKILVPGRRTQPFVWDVSTGTLPSWLTLATAGANASSTLTFGGTGAGAYAQLAPNAALSATAELQAASIDLTLVTMIRLTLRNVTFSHQLAVGMSLGAWSDDALYGGRLTIPAGTSAGGSHFAQLTTFPTSSSNNPTPGDTNYEGRLNAEYRKPRDYEYRLFPQTRWGWAAESDSPFAYWQHRQVGLGAVIPRVRCAMPTSGSVAARYLQFSRMELEVAYL